jgi:hypothetical protein
MQASSVVGCSGAASQELEMGKESICSSSNMYVQSACIIAAGAVAASDLGNRDTSRCKDPGTILERVLCIIHDISLGFNVVLKSKMEICSSQEASSSEYLKYLSSVYLFYLKNPYPQTNHIVLCLP